MKKTRIALAGALVLALFCSTASALPVLTITGNGVDAAGPLTVLLGDTINIEVRVADVSEVAGFTINIGITNLTTAGPPTMTTALGSWWTSGAAALGAPHADWNVNTDIYNLGPYSISSVLMGAYGGTDWVLEVDPETGEGVWVPGEAPPEMWALSGGGVIATFKYKANAMGSAQVSIIGSLLGSSGSATTDPEEMDHTVGAALEINVVPEPATLALLSAGLFGLVAYRRRK